MPRWWVELTLPQAILIIFAMLIMLSAACVFLSMPVNEGVESEVVPAPPYPPASTATRDMRAP